MCMLFSNSCRWNKWKDLFSRRYFLTCCFIKSLLTFLCLRFSTVYLLLLCLCQRKLVCFGLEEMMTLKWLLCTESCWDELPNGSSQCGRLFVCRWLFLWLAANPLLFFAFDLQPNSSASLALSWLTWFTHNKLGQLILSRASAFVSSWIFQWSWQRQVQRDREIYWRANQPKKFVMKHCYIFFFVLLARSVLWTPLSEKWLGLLLWSCCASVFKRPCFSAHKWLAAL